MAVYALSDLHGNLELLREIQKFLNEDDTVYFLGDGGDRGPKPWETIGTITTGESAIVSNAKILWVKTILANFL